MLLVVIFAVSAASGQTADLTSAMKADVERLVARAEKLEALWPWQGPIPEIQQVVRHGKVVAPSLVALLADDPDDDTVDPVVNWRLQQQVALALCQLYGVRAECGHVYCNRTSRDRNQEVKRFWRARIAEPLSQDMPLLTSEDIAALVGGERDIKGIVAVVFTHAFRNGSKEVFFRGSQFRRDWLPSVSGVEFQLLADGDLADHVKNCGRYWEITRAERVGNTVALELRQRCGCSSRLYVASFDGQQWRLGPADLPSGFGWGPGIGSGCPGPPIGCPCFPR